MIRHYTLASQIVKLTDLQSAHLEPDAGKEGTLSLRAATTLTKLGFPFVKVVEGNLDELQKAGFLHYKP